MSTGFFGNIQSIKYEGPDSTNPLAFRHYNKDEVVLGKRMEDHLRFAVAYWHSRLTGVSAADLTKELGDALKPPSGVTFLPYLSGERTPHNDAAIRGAFLGLGHESGRPVLTQAVLEGVSFALRDNLEALKSAGTRLSRVTAIGGGSRSRYWLKSIATALNLPVDLPADGDFGAAFGAARLGLIAAIGANPVEVLTAPATAETIEPEATLTAAYEDAYRRYCRLYPAIRAAY